MSPWHNRNTLCVYRAVRCSHRTLQLVELADVLGLCPAGSRAAKARVFIDAIYRMNRALGIPECFPCIRSEDLPQMAAWAEANPVYPVPVIFGKEDFICVARRVMP